MDAKIAFYQQQWQDIYHMDMLDWRVIAVFGSLITFSDIVQILIPVMFPRVIEMEDWYWFIFFANLINFWLAVYGMWSVVKDQVYMLIKMLQIQKVEKDMNLSNYVLKRMREGNFPKNKFDFTKRMFKTSRRGPLVIIYLVLAFASMFSLFLGIRTLLGDYFWTIGVILAIIFPFLAVGITLYFQSKDYCNMIENEI